MCRGWRRGMCGRPPRRGPIRRRGPAEGPSPSPSRAAPRHPYPACGGPLSRSALRLPAPTLTASPASRSTGVAGCCGNNSHVRGGTNRTRALRTPSARATCGWLPFTRTSGNRVQRSLRGEPRERKGATSCCVLM
jgi:hypothetical protein